MAQGFQYGMRSAQTYLESASQILFHTIVAWNNVKQSGDEKNKHALHYNKTNKWMKSQKLPKQIL